MWLVCVGLSGMAQNDNFDESWDQFSTIRQFSSTTHAIPKHRVLKTRGFSRLDTGFMAVGDVLPSAVLEDAPHTHEAATKPEISGSLVAEVHMER